MTRRIEHKKVVKDPHQAFKYYVVLMVSLTFLLVANNTNTLRMQQLETKTRDAMDQEDGVVRPACKFEREAGQNNIYTCIF